MEVEAVYENGVLKLVSPVKIDEDRIIVNIINRDEVMTDEDMRDLIEATEEREKGNYYRMDEVFE